MHKRTEDIKPGDVIRFMGQWRRVTETGRRNAFGWPIAEAADGWAMALEPGQLVEVA